jgi:hypothetical protein
MREKTMAVVEPAFKIYEQVAERFAARNDARHRDMFLALAADAALAASRPAEAERLRARLLQASPNSLFKPFASFPEALRSADIQLYLQDLKRQYPVAEAAKLLEPPRKDHAAAATPAPAPDANVYRLRAEDKASPPAASPAAQAPSRPDLLPAVPQAPSSEAPPPLGTAPPQQANGAWINSLLFLLMLLLGLGVAALSLVRPVILPP